MSEKNSYQKVGNVEKNGVYSEKEKISWLWTTNEKKIFIAAMTLFWSYLFIDFFIMNQKLSNEIKGLSDGVLGFKRVDFFNNIF